LLETAARIRPAKEISILDLISWTTILTKLQVEPGGPGRESSDTERSEVHTLVFATEKQNLIGHTDGAAAVNDIVCWFMGGRVPYILRQQGDCWQYVGQA
jgi:hypothetical protein